MLPFLGDVAPLAFRRPSEAEKWLFLALRTPSEPSWRPKTETSVFSYPFSCTPFFLCSPLPPSTVQQWINWEFILILGVWGKWWSHIKWKLCTSLSFTMGGSLPVISVKPTLAVYYQWTGQLMPDINHHLTWLWNPSKIDCGGERPIEEAKSRQTAKLGEEGGSTQRSAAVHMGSGWDKTPGPLKDTAGNGSALKINKQPLSSLPPCVAVTATQAQFEPLKNMPIPLKQDNVKDKQRRGEVAGAGVDFSSSHQL